MTLQIPLTPELESQLRARAAASGLDPVAFVLKLVEAGMGQSTNGHPESSAMHTDDWAARWKTWAAGHHALGHPVDDGRDNIYDGRRRR